MTGALINAMLLIVGTLSFACACTLIISPPLTKYWAHRWVRMRFRTFDRAPTQSVVTMAALVSCTSNDINSDHNITDFLDAIARDVRSGFSLASSFVQCSDRLSDSDHWSNPISQRILRGVTLSDALGECALPAWTSEIRFASRTLAVASAGGIGVARALEHSASVLREQQGLVLDRDMQSAQTQLSTKVLTWLPIAVFIWICITDPIARMFLVSTPLGMGCVAAGITLNVSGRKWMTHVVNNISV